MPKTKVVLKRSDDYPEMLADLGEAHLEKKHLCELLDYLRDLSKRQKRTARAMKHQDKLSYNLNMSDYFATQARIEETLEQLTEVNIRIRDLGNGVEDCYRPSTDELVAWAEACRIEEEYESEDEKWQDDEPVVDLSQGANEAPAVEESPAGEAPATENPAEPYIDDAS